jgi:hypothetical protein
MTPLAIEIVAEIRDRPRQFSEIVDMHRDVAWPEFLRAWGEVRGNAALARDDDGHYLIGEKG